MSQEQQQQCIEVFKSSYVLKVCGVCQYLLQNAPMIQYKVLVCVFYAVKLTGDQYLTFLFDVYAVHTQVHVNEEDTATDAVKPRDCSQHDQGPVRLRVQSAFIRSKRSVLMLHSALHDVIVIFTACMNVFLGAAFPAGRGVSSETNGRAPTLLWKIEDMFRVTIRSATYVNTRDSGKVSEEYSFSQSYSR